MKFNYVGSLVERHFSKISSVFITPMNKEKKLRVSLKPDFQARVNSVFEGAATTASYKIINLVAQEKTVYLNLKKSYIVIPYSDLCSSRYQISLLFGFDIINSISFGTRFDLDDSKIQRFKKQLLKSSICE